MKGKIIAGVTFLTGQEYSRRNLGPLQQVKIEAVPVS